MFIGSYVALITPMDINGKVDYQSLRRLVDLHVESGTDGIVSVGTTGESATLPFDEHVEAVKKTVEFAQNRIPVIAGSGANSTDEAVALTEQLSKTGIKGCLSVVPYYNKPQQRGMIAHFEAIANSTDLPTLLYNVPGRTSVDMLPSTVAELAEHPKIVGLKDATGDIQRLRDTLPLVSEKFLFLSGDDVTSVEFLKAGGHGVISVTANIVPVLMARMCKLLRLGEYEQALVINEKIKVLHQDLFVESNPVISKWALYKMGLIETPKLRLPLVTPELVSQKQIEDTLKSLALIS